MRPVLSLVPPRSADPAGSPDDASLPLTVPVADAGGSPWGTDGGTARVPAVLLLAAAGRCSCDDCCAVLAAQRRRQHLSAV